MFPGHDGRKPRAAAMTLEEAVVAEKAACEARRQCTSGKRCARLRANWDEHARKETRREPRAESGGVRHRGARTRWAGPQVHRGAIYIEHPRAVVALVRSVPHDEAMLAAAWLHDTVEDTGADIATILHEFGPDVGVLVDWLTDVSKPSDGNRKVRKALDRAHLSKAPPRAKTIKLGAVSSTTRAGIVERDPDFAKVYLAEKRELLAVLTEGDESLLNQARAIAFAPVSLRAF